MTSPSETIAKAIEGVTAGEWIVNGDRFSVETNATYIPDQKVIALCATGEGAMARALYIAACNPVAMREVLNELSALRKAVGDDTRQFMQSLVDDASREKQQRSALTLQFEAMKREMAEKDERIAALEEALRPFAGLGNDLRVTVTVGDVRRARTLTQGDKP